MNFLKLRADLGSLQIVGFWAVILWSFTGSTNLVAGFALLFALVGFGVATSIRESLKSRQIFNPITEFFSGVIGLYLQVHIVLALVTTWVVLQGSNLKGVWLQSALNMSIGIGNWQQINRPENFFSPDSALSPFVHLWFVSGAIQFILALCFIGFLVSFIRVEPSILIRRVLVGLLFILAVYFLFNFYANAISTNEFFLNTWSWTGFVLFGAALSFVNLRLPESKVNSVAGDIVFFSVLLVLILSTFSVYLFQQYFMFIVLLLLVVPIILSVNETYNFRLLTSRWGQRIAWVSFGTFLWHWPLAQVAKSVLKVEVLSNIQAFAVISFSVLLAVMTTKFTSIVSEKLVQVGGLRQWTSALALLSLAPAVLFLLQTPVTNNLEPNPQETFTFKPTIDQIAADVPDYVSNSNCEKDSTTCIYGNERSKTHVLLYGTALAGNWQPALAQLAEEEDWKLEVRINLDCPITEITKECEPWLKRISKYVLRVKPDLVISNFSAIGSMSIPDISQPEAATRPSAPREMINRDLLTWSEFLDAGIKVAALRGPAIFAGDPIECLRTATSITSCVSAQADVYLTTNELKRYLQFASTQLRIIDISNVFCSNAKCPIVSRDDIVMYRTNVEITKTFSLSLAKFLRADLLEVLNTELKVRPKNCLPGDPRPECQ